MPKPPKPIKVETVTYEQAGFSADILYDTVREEFYCDFTGHRYAAKTQAQCRMQVQNAMEAAAHVEWQPMIPVESLKPFGKPSANPYFIGFELTRFYYAEVGPRREQKRANWPDDVEANDVLFGPNHMLRFAYDFFWMREWGEFRPPCAAGKHHHSSDYDTYYMPYTEERWAGLLQLQEAIRTLKGRLVELLTTEEGIARLGAAGPMLLGPGRKEEESDGE